MMVSSISNMISAMFMSTLNTVRIQKIIKQIHNYRYQLFMGTQQKMYEGWQWNGIIWPAILWHIILNLRWKCLRWCYLCMSDHHPSVMCNVSDYPGLHNWCRWWWLITCIITQPSPHCHLPTSPGLYILHYWFDLDNSQSNVTCEWKRS